MAKEPSSPRRLEEVRRRARKLQEERGWGYGKAMKMAGWQVAKAAGDRHSQTDGKGG